MTYGTPPGVTCPGDQPSGYLDMPLGEFLAALAAAEPAPSGGGAAALSVALGAGLCAMSAGLSGRQLGARAGGLRADAERLRDRAASLIQADADAYAGVLTARRAGDVAEVAAALAAATAVPMQIAELGAEVAALAGRLAADSNPSLRGDVITAALLARAGVAAAAALVHINLAEAPDDDRSGRALRLLQGVDSMISKDLAPFSPPDSSRS
jgi:methenyltetrahydrofolate cyclohydrolase